MAQLCRLLTKAGATVQVVMTEAAQQSITPVTMQALSGRPVFTSQWDARPENNMAHINLSRAADAIVIAPCSADFAAKLAQGRADELLSLLCLARPHGKPLLLAPAMNREMWAHPATQRNFAQAAADGAQVLDVGQGEQACGECGRWPHAGARRADPRHCRQLGTQAPGRAQGVDYGGARPLRRWTRCAALTNHSSGKMGFAIAAAAQAAGAEVTLVAGPVHLPTPRGVQRINVQSARRDAGGGAKSGRSKQSIFIATAAVADSALLQFYAQKIKKDGVGDVPSAGLCREPRHPGHRGPVRARTAWRSVLRGLCRRKAMICWRTPAPSVCARTCRCWWATSARPPLGRTTNASLLMDAHGHRGLPRASKAALGVQLVQELARRLPPAPRP